MLYGLKTLDDCSVYGKKVLFILDAQDAKEDSRTLLELEELGAAEIKTLTGTGDATERKDHGNHFLYGEDADEIFFDVCVCDGPVKSVTLMNAMESIPCVIGRKAEEDLKSFGFLMTPELPYICVFGETTLGSLDFLERVIQEGKPDRILTGSGIAISLLKASGIFLNHNAPAHPHIPQPLSHTDLRYANLLRLGKGKLTMPVDFAGIVGDVRKDTLLEKARNDSTVFRDIGIQTAQEYVQFLQTAKTIFIRGTMGNISDDRTALGTQLVMEAAERSAAKIAVCGHSAQKAAEKFNIPPNRCTYIRSDVADAFLFEDSPTRAVLLKSASVM